MCPDPVQRLRQHLMNSQFRVINSQLEQAKGLCSWRRKLSKVKLTRYTPWKGRGGRGGIAPLFLNLGTRRGWVASITPRPHFTPGERNTGTYCTGDWVGPRAGWAQRIDEKSTASVGDRTPVAQSVSILTELPSSRRRKAGETKLHEVKCNRV
jgi:hypothetical protein